MQPIIIPDVQITFPEFRQIQQWYMLRQRWWLVPLTLLYPLYSIWGGNDSSFGPTGKLIATLLMTAVVTGAIIYSTRSALQRMFEQTPYF
ncbi:hypothetical protein [Hymenobacter rigui]|uniref:Uncharacterized protein n=1 Tax=Hymenobacter rigui TaxID=334424 RepID=A0A428KP93_9BACT|nr:hypothetical protein [Hymenobacter rigui]RSK48256.1 hypothetical protein EI291_11015 [Hymenobacter rigui]